MISVRQIPPRPLPKPKTEIQKQGLRYEKRVIKQLKRHWEVEHNPWFETQVQDDHPKFLCPDAIIWQQGQIIVLEVKLTYTPEALKKLKEKYVPAVEQTYEGSKVLPLVIAKNTPPIAGIPGENEFRVFHQSLKEALGHFWPVYFWSGRGPLN